MANIRETYDFYMEKYEKLRTQLNWTMEMLNSMADDLDIQRPFDSVYLFGGKPKLRQDQFVNKPLATAVYEYLSLSGKAIGAKPWPEIVQALRDGGFEGLAKTKVAEEAARTNILKSTKIRLVGDNSFGLVEWYPKKRKTKEGEEEIVEESNEEKPKRGRPPKKGKEDTQPKPEEPKAS